MRIIIEIDNDKSLTVSPVEKTGMSSDSLTNAPAQAVETVDGGAAPTGQFSTLENAALTTADVAIIDGGTAPVFANS